MNVFRKSMDSLSILLFASAEGLKSFGEASADVGAPMFFHQKTTNLWRSFGESFGGCRRIGISSSADLVCSLGRPTNSIQKNE